jgi:hypothetical protein
MREQQQNEYERVKQQDAKKAQVKDEEEFKKIAERQIIEKKEEERE